MVKPQFKVLRVLRTFSFYDYQGKRLTVKAIWDNADRARCTIDMEGAPACWYKLASKQYIGYKHSIRQDLVKLIREYLKSTRTDVSSFDIIDESLTLIAGYGIDSRASWHNEIAMKFGIPEDGSHPTKTVTYFGIPRGTQVTAYFDNCDTPRSLDKDIADYRGLVSTFRQLVQSGQV